MDPSFIPIEVVPTKTPFALDQLRRSYKTPLSAEAAIAAAPNVGDADEVFPFMFLMPITTPETAESATRIDLVYMGCLRDDGEGNPILPQKKHQNDNSVASATSSRSSGGGIPPASPMTVQFYAPTSVLSYVTFGAPGTTNAPNPSGDIIVIQIIIGDAAFTGSIGSIVASYFTTQFISTIKSEEIVPAQFWQNVASTRETLTQSIFLFPSGPHVSIASGSQGYAAGDVITITDSGQTATVRIDAPLMPYGYILNYTQLTNDFTSPASLIAGSPPTHGPPNQTALWNVVII